MSGGFSSPTRAAGPRRPRSPGSRPGSARGRRTGSAPTPTGCRPRDRPPAPTGPRFSAGLAPPTQFRREFWLDEPPSRARCYASARGIYRLQDERRPGRRPRQLAPGWTEYHRRIQYQTYDITGLLQAGANAVGITVADGWWCGYVGADPRHHAQHYGTRPEAIAQIVADGQRIGNRRRVALRAGDDPLRGPADGGVPGRAPRHRRLGPARVRRLRLGPGRGGQGAAPPCWSPSPTSRSGSSPNSRRFRRTARSWTSARTSPAGSGSRSAARRPGSGSRCGTARCSTAPPVHREPPHRRGHRHLHRARPTGRGVRARLHRARVPLRRDHRAPGRRGRRHGAGAAQRHPLGRRVLLLRPADQPDRVEHRLEPARQLRRGAHRLPAARRAARLARERAGVRADGLPPRRRGRVLRPLAARRAGRPAPPPVPTATSPP